MKYDILISGVGGQGQVLASRLIGAAAIGAGFRARTGETIGMAQRGGCVVSNVRVGDDLMSPTVPYGQADLIIGFELCETARVLPRLSSFGRVVCNDHVISPITVSLGLQNYSRDGMMEYIKRNAKNLLIIDANRLAVEAGSEKAANVVLLGASVGAGYLPFSREAMIKSLKTILPQKLLALNLAAFDGGYHFAKERQQ